MAQLIPIENVGAGGIITDVQPYQLQPNQWSNGSNVIFQNGAVTKIKGYAEVMKTCPIRPWHLGTYQEHSHAGKVERQGFYWIALGMTKIYVSHNDEWHDITRESGDYNTLEGSNWKVCTSGALFIATNGVDVPQMWKLGEDNKVSVDNKMIDLPNWPIDDLPGTGSNDGGTQENCLNSQTMSGFRSILVATNIMKNTGIRDELQNRVVKWSQPHSHYAPPITWDPFDDKSDCGEYELLETQGPIVDTLAMGELFMIYKTDSVYMMSFIGTPYIFSFKTLEPEVGLLCKGALAQYPGGHFFVSNSDCYINNGQSVVPILTGKVRTQLFSDMSGDFYDRTFCVTDETQNQIMVCYPTATSSYCNKALIWNYKDNNFSFKTLPMITDIKKGVKKSYTTVDKDDPAMITWTGDNSVDPCMPAEVCTPWNGDFDLKWGGVSYENVVHHMVYCAPGDAEVKQGIYRDSVGEMEDGNNMYSYVERTGIDLGDPSSVKHVTAIWPKIETKAATTMKVYTGFQMATDEPMQWEGPYIFNPNSQTKISTRTTGKFFGIRFETEEDTTWTLSALEFEIAPAGRRGRRIHV